ncbi:unnamed protein product [Thlaspi arvense]|uniref:Uncharacterized protein n=1 Tax=Thlaspi arvense TaxID=13288 RepID=A0AAU9T553_THLAR|nr:unnamed protein product [Thlaspi arvense]
MSSEMDDSSPVRRRVSCTKSFDALWFCYCMFSPLPCLVSETISTMYVLLKGCLDGPSKPAMAMRQNKVGFLRKNWNSLEIFSDLINSDDLFAAPFYQMQQYYRVGRLDDCSKKFSDLFDCLSLKTKRASEAEKILEEQEKADAAKHIWIMRTQEEASSHWNETFGHLDDPNC